VKEIAAIVFSILPCLAAVVGAAVLAFYGKDGWGWLLFIAVCLAPNLRVQS
jgi:hypothetical protein